MYRLVHPHNIYASMASTYFLANPIDIFCRIIVHSNMLSF